VDLCPKAKCPATGAEAVFGLKAKAAKPSKPVHAAQYMSETSSRKEKNEVARA
jgi:hypothetical protein